MPIAGIDVSVHQGNIDWTKVKNSSKVQFAILRAGISTRQDEKFDRNYQGCKSNGIPCGIYWFCKAVNTAEAVQEANACLKAISGKSLEYPIYYDIEDVESGDKQHKIASLGITTVSAIAVAFLETLRKAGVSNLGVYSFKSALDTLFKPEVLQSYKVWVAQTGNKCTFTKSTYSMWQYSWKGRISGISGDVDLDYDYGAASATVGRTLSTVQSTLTKVEFATQYAIAMANDDSHGYDQTYKWGNPDFDCSGLVITAYQQAGVPVKDNGAYYTGNMKDVFLKAGFQIVPGFPAGGMSLLQRGDVLLYRGSDGGHTAIYIGDGQVVEASINERGGTHGGQHGDQTGKEVKVGKYYANPHRSTWTYALRYTLGGYATNTLGLNGLLAYGSAFGGAVSIDWIQMTPYIATLDRTCTDVDFEKLKELKVIAVMIEGGYLYDTSHMKVSRYRNPLIDEQVRGAKDAEMSYALYADVRARNIDEANAELHELQFLIRKYTPPLGCWLAFNFKEEDKSKNDSIIKVYRDKLHKLGLVGKIGFYVNRDQLSAISWDEWQEDFYWWMVDHVQEIEEVDQLLTPEFFMLNAADIESHMITGIPYMASTDGSVYTSEVPQSGDTITIPASVNQTGVSANYTNYSYWFGRWKQSTVQYKISMLWANQGNPSDRNIATVSGHYLLAMSQKFGTTGDLLTIYLEDGTSFTAIMADSKGYDAQSPWGHYLGNNRQVDIIEWEMKGSATMAADSSTKIDLTGWKGKRVAKVVNHGRFSLIV